MFVVQRCAAGALLLLLPLGAHAFGFGWLFRGQSTSYYYPAPAPYANGRPVLTYPVCPPTVAPMRLVPPAAPAPSVYAAPVPAPPSAGPVGLPPVAPSPVPPPEPRRDPFPSPEPPPAAPKSVPLSPPSGDALIPREQAPPPPERLKVPPPPEPGGLPPPLDKPAMPKDPVSPPFVPRPDPDPGRSASRSYYDAYPVVARAAVAAGSPLSVSFWNLSDRELQVTVAGQARRLARGQKWTVELPRRFRWQIAGRAAQEELVGDHETGLEIVVRR